MGKAIIRRTLQMWQHLLKSSASQTSSEPQFTMDNIPMKKKAFVAAKDMAKKIKRTHIGKNQNKIMDILSKYGELTARDIAEILWARDIHYKTPEYSSTHRSLAALHQKGLVEKTDGKIKWRKTRKTRMSRGRLE